MIKKSIYKLVDFIVKHYIVVLLLFIAVTAATGYISYKRFKIKTSLTALLPEHSQSVLMLQELNKRKASTDNMVVVLESENIELSKQFAKVIHDELKNDEFISNIEYYRDVSFIKDRLLLQVSIEDLTNIKEKIQEKISEKKVDTITNLGLEEDNTDIHDEELEDEGDPFKKEEEAKNEKVEKKSNVDFDENIEDKEIVEMIENDEITEEERLEFEGDPFKTAEHKKEKPVLKKADKHADSSNFLQYLNDKLNKYNQSFSSRFKDWRISQDGRILVVMITPVKPAGDIDFSLKLRKHLKEKMDELQSKNPQFKEIDVNFSGAYITTIDETNEVKKDVFSSIGLSIGLIVLVLFLYFGRILLLSTILIPLMSGMIWTAGVFFLFESYLNLIAAFIFAILLGLGIDFGIHCLSRYNQEKENGLSMSDALKVTLTETGFAVIMGGATTIAAFLTLLLADFQGFSQFGKLASLGIVFSLTAIYIVFPLLITIFEKHLGGVKGFKNYYVIIFAKLFKKKELKPAFPFVKTIMISTLFLLIGSSVLLVIKPIKFEYNFNKLGKKDGKREMIQSKYKSAIENSLSPTVILSDSKEETKKIHDALAELTKTFTDIVPQPAIFPFIGEYNVYVTYNMTESIKTAASVYSFYPEQQEEKYKLLQDIDGMLTKSRIKKLKKEEQESIEELKPYLTKATPFKIDDLPEFTKNLFMDKSGSFDKMLFLYVKVDTSDGRNAIKFAKEIRSIKVDNKKLKVTGQHLIFADILTLMIKDGSFISLLALGVIYLLLLISSRSLKGSILMIMPLIIGMLFTFALMSIFGLKLNFYNIIVLPSLIGMGIDNSIHLYYRIKESKTENVMEPYSKIIASISLATITTIIGFAGLLTANHFGLNSIGILTIVGMTAMWMIVAFSMPAFMQYIINRKKNKN